MLSVYLCSIVRPISFLFSSLALILLHSDHTRFTVISALLFQCLDSVVQVISRSYLLMRRLWSQYASLYLSGNRSCFLPSTAELTASVFGGLISEPCRTAQMPGYSHKESRVNYSIFYKDSSLLSGLAYFLSRP